MKAEELLRPRFVVIDEYPRCQFMTGDILIRIKHATKDVFHTDENAPVGGLDLEDIQRYPLLFRRLNWWENRKKEDMPKRLILKALEDDTRIFEIEDWDMEMMVAWTNKAKRECCSIGSFNPKFGYFPVD